MYQPGMSDFDDDVRRAYVKRIDVAIVVAAATRARQMKDDDIFPRWFRHFATCHCSWSANLADAIVIDSRGARDTRCVKEAALFARERLGNDKRVVAVIRGAQGGGSLRRFCAVNAIGLLDVSIVCAPLFLLAYVHEDGKIPFLVKLVEEMGSPLSHEVASVVAVLLASRFRIGSVKQVAHVLQCHPTTLQRRLMAHARVEPALVIDRCKALATRSLLVDTDLSIRAIAEQMGFASSRSLNELLVRTLGVGASATRRHTTTGHYSL